MIITVDTTVNLLLSSVRTSTIAEVFFDITLFGEVFTVIFFAILASLFLWRKHLKKEILALWVALSGSSATTYLLKIIIDRPRPVDAIILEDSASFPSGHATAAVAFYGFLAYLLACQIKSKKYRAPIILAGAILILLIGFSRLYLGVHYFSDVLAGYLVGLLWLLVGIGYNRRGVKTK